MQNPVLGQIDTVEIHHADGTVSTAKFLVVAVVGSKLDPPAEPVEPPAQQQ